MRIIKNIYFCVIFPMLISGFITLGFVTLFRNNPTGIILIIWLAGCCGYLVASLVKSEWVEEKSLTKLKGGIK